MKRALIIFLFINTFLNCQSISEEKFSEEALQDQFINFDGDSVSFKSILDKHYGRDVLIGVWASWCKDCIKSLPKLQELQSSYPNLDYIFLSLDKSQKAWRRGIERNNLEGEHYFMSSGWKGAMGDFLNLDWIPRYLLVNTEGEIVVYKAVKLNDKNLLKNLK